MTNIKARLDEIAKEAAVEIQKFAPECCGSLVYGGFDEEPECCGSPEPRDKTPLEVAIDVRAAIDKAIEVVLSNPTKIARMFHDNYERLAPQYGYTTRSDTKEWDPKSVNAELMIATCRAMSSALLEELKK